MPVDRITKKWIKNKRDEAAADAGMWFNLKAFDRVRTFFSKFLRHSSGKFAGKPFDLLPWQENDLIGPGFGWYRPDGTRRYRKFSVWVAKKNGKSALASAMSLYLMIGDGEPGALVCASANDREQASIVYNEAANMVQASPVLLKQLDLLRSTKRILHKPSHSTFKAISSDSARQQGLQFSAVIMDELHSWSGERGRAFFDCLKYGGRARKQPLLIIISTAGWDRLSVGYDEYMTACKVRDGIIDIPDLLPVIYEVSPEEDWHTEEAWTKANPSMPHIITLDNMRSDYNEAKGSPTKERAFRQYLLNTWMDSSTTKFLPNEALDRCKLPAVPIQQPLPTKDTKAKPHQRSAVAAFDLASNRDTTALVVASPDGDFIDVEAYCFVPESKLRNRSDRVDYRLWADQGHIIVTPGDITDHGALRAKLNEIAKNCNIRTVAFDPWQATTLATLLRDEDGFEMESFPGTFKTMTTPIKELERLVLEGKIRGIVDNPVLRWQLNNIALTTDANENCRPDKDKSGAMSGNRIDLGVALLMCIGLIRNANDLQALIEVW